MNSPAGPQPPPDQNLPVLTRPPRMPGIGSGIAMVVVYFLLQLVIGVIVIALYGLVAGVGDDAGVPGMAERAGASPMFQAAYTTIGLAIAALVTLLLVRRMWPALWHESMPPGFGFVAPPNAWFFVLAVVVAVGGTSVGGMLTGVLAHGQPVQQDIKVLGSQLPLGMFLLLALVAVWVAPVVEETLFRGVLLSGLMRSMPATPAVIISAVIFGGVHYPDFGFVWYPLPALALIGLLLGWIRLVSRSLWPAITLHATVNLVAVVAWFVAGHGHG